MKNVTRQTTTTTGKPQWLIPNPRSNQMTHNPANHGNQAQNASFPKVPHHPSKQSWGAMGDTKPVNPSKQPKGTVFGGGVF